MPSFLDISTGRGHELESHFASGFISLSLRLNVHKCDQSLKFFPRNICKEISKIIYYMANPVLGKSPCSDWFFLGQDFAIRTVSMETVQSVYFCFGAKPANSKFATKIAKKTVNIVILHNETTRRSKKDWNFSEISNFKMSRMKGSVGLLSIAMRTIDFEAIFYQRRPVLN